MADRSELCTDSSRNGAEKHFEKRHLLVPFRTDPEKHDTNVFLNALKDEKRTKRGTTLLVPKSLQRTLASLRRTVLKPSSPGSLLPAGAKAIDRNIAAAEELVSFLKKVKVQHPGQHGKKLLVPKPLQATIKAIRKTILNPLSHGNSTKIGKVEIERAIKAANLLVKIAGRCKAKEETAP